MNRHEINRAFDAFSKMRVLVIGDIMIDAYMWGKVSRISPEAPVPIVNIHRKEYRLGGSANVALNLKKLGAEPLICGVTGNDPGSQIFLDLLAQEELESTGIITEKNRPTTIKTRVIGSSQQLLRIDEEITHSITETTAKSLIKRITDIIENQKIDAIIFEDYDKGLLNASTINEIVTIANRKNILISVDPKRINFFNYKNVTLFKPNLKELNEGLKTEIAATDFDKIHQIAQQFCKEQGVENLVVTLSEHGILISGQQDFTVIPAAKRDIADVSGAGDTVISVLTLCRAFGLSVTDAARLANLAGGLVCEKVGVVPISRNLLLDEAISVFS